jgi:acyl-CoA reductase-like NAD-dependent aldehyde dehydrogenase
MSVDPSRIGAIVAEVLDRLDRDPADPSGVRPLGIHATLDEAVTAARRAFEAWRETPLEVRDRVIASIREAIVTNAETLAKLAVDETGLGRVSDKILKNRLVASKTPGTEDLEPVAWTGDHGLTLMERAPTASSRSSRR